MRLATFILILSLAQVSAAGFAQKLSFTKKGATMSEIFAQIELQTDFNVFYSDESVNNKLRYNVNFKDENLFDVLDVVLRNQSLSYRIDNNNIIIKPKNFQTATSQTHHTEQNSDVKGRVLGRDGQPLAGVTVKIKGTNKVTNTNDKGAYVLTDVPENSLLTFSFVGYVTKELPAEPVMRDVVLEEGVKELEAVAVTGNTGYEKISRDRSTGAFDVVGQEVLSRRPVSNLSTALQGTVAGLQAKENVDGSVSFLLRGAGTLSTDIERPLSVTQPLVVVDGFAISGFDFNNINPNDVESVTVLKDAASLSIWGSRGANGVIVVTTKSPKVGRTSVEARAFTRVSQMIDLDQVMLQANSADHIAYEKLAFDRNLLFFPYAGGFYDIESPLTLAQEQLFAFKYGAITESQLNTELARLSAIDNRPQIKDHLMRNAILNQVTLNFSGGTERMKTSASMLYENNKEGFIKRGYDRAVLNFNNNFTATRFMTLNFGANIHYRKNDFSGVGGETGTDISELEGLSPYELLLNPDGTYGVNLRSFNRAELNNIPSSKFPYQDWSYNLLREVRGRERNSENLSARIQAGVNLKLGGGVTFDGSGQYEKRKINTSSHFNEETFAVRGYVNSYVEYDDDSKTVGRVFLPKGGILRSSQSDYRSYTLRGQFNYDKNIGERHQITAIAGSEIFDELITGQTNPTVYGYFPEKNQVTVPPYGYGSSVTPLRYFTYGTAAVALPTEEFPGDAGSTILNWNSNRLASFYSSVGYTLDQKYTLSGSIRSDASNFITDNPKLRWTPLWSVGAMWRISNENFMQSLNWMDRLNLRFTYGVTGLANQSVSTQTLVNISNSPSPVSGTITGAVGTIGNPLLRWERNYNTELGIDFTLFKGKLLGKVDAYNRLGKDIVGNIALPSASGALSGRVNNASIYNRGIEVELGTNVDITQDFSYNTNLTYAYNKNKITSLYFPAVYAYEMIDGQYIEGRPVGSVFAYKYAGMVDGVPHVLGPNEVPTTTNSAALSNTGLGKNFLSYEGTSIPPHTMGWINNFRYKDFNLMMVITGTFGGKFRRPIFNYSTIIGSFKSSVDRFVSDVFAGDPTIPAFPQMDEQQYYLWDRYTPNLQNLVESSSFVELKEINLEYFLPQSLVRKVSFSNVKVYAQLRNVGLLFTDNSRGYHPEWLPGTNRPVGTYTFGLNLQF
ncbi:SusC/RagA family TonB-linked outer membrane protein [Pedobacter deserti]|uniref:SusC/RagA family TonB-linked outer membrane protein n=1 Tax=Pedobacter deserti TaxID=2817382 RepID=UPI0021090C21|nr:SusC/RagA family TonB-linked outer membrane protein [Pedobacter sp. SYSU D00382]